MTLMEMLLLIVIILLSYFSIVFLLKKIGIFEKYNISLYGPALLLRTKKGISVLKKISSKKRFWQAYSSTGIVFCFISMVIFVIFFIWQFIFVIGLSSQQRAEILPSANFYLILPGINPILPLDYIIYILLAFIVAIIVHEFSHGILTLAGDLKVKSMGLLYFIFPIGAFVEPDEEQMKKTKISKRMRVYAVGPFSNFVTFFICILLFSFVFMSAVQSAEGADVINVYPNTPAEEIGLKTGSIITSINDTKIDNIDECRRVLENTTSNRTVNISYLLKGKLVNTQVKLTTRYDYISLYTDEEVNESLKNNSFLGIGFNSFSNTFISTLKNPFKEPTQYFLLFMALPIYGYFEGYNPLASPFAESYIITGPLGSIPSSVFWFFVNSLYWVGWLNLMVGIFNILPMIPLDGGFLFNDGIKSIVRKVKKDMSEENSNKIVSKISLFVSLFILLIILSPIFLKYI